MSNLLYNILTYIAITCYELAFTRIFSLQLWVEFLEHAIDGFENYSVYSYISLLVLSILSVLCGFIDIAEDGDGDDDIEEDIEEDDDDDSVFSIVPLLSLFILGGDDENDADSLYIYKDGSVLHLSAYYNILQIAICDVAFEDIQDVLEEELYVDYCSNLLIEHGLFSLLAMHFVIMEDGFIGNFCIAYWRVGLFKLLSNLLTFSYTGFLDDLMYVTVCFTIVLILVLCCFTNIIVDIVVIGCLCFVIVLYFGIK